MEALAAKGEPPPRRMTLPLPGKSQSAQLARQLHEIGPDGFDCIVCADGFLPPGLPGRAETRPHQKGDLPWGLKTLREIGPIWNPD